MVDGSVTASIDLDALVGAQSGLRFAASTRVIDDHGSDDTLNVTFSEDRVPDDEDDWRTLDEGAAE